MLHNRAAGQDLMDLPQAQGLYDPRNEHDSCGVGFVADIKGRESHAIVREGLSILVNLDHHCAVAMCFLPQDEAARTFAVKRLEHFIKVEKQKLLGWREVPTDITGLGKAVIE